MIESNFRAKVQPFFDWISRQLIKFGITGNIATLISFISGLLCGIFIWLNFLYLALILLWVSGLFDVLDGTIARILKNSKKAGAYLDLFSDRVVEVVVILGFTFLLPENYLAYILFLISLLMHFSTFLISGALFKNETQKSFKYDKSLVERAEAFIAFSFMMIFPIYAFEILMFFTVLVFACAVSRFYRVLEFAKKVDKGLI